MSEQQMNPMQVSGMPPVVSPQVMAEAELIGRSASSLTTEAAKVSPIMGIPELPVAEPNAEGEVARIMAVAVEHMDKMKGLPEIKEVMAQGSTCAFADGSKTSVRRGRRTKLIASLVACAAIASGMIGFSGYRLYHPEGMVTPVASAPAAPAVASVIAPTTQMAVSNSSNSTFVAADVKPAEIAKPAAALAKASPMVAARSLTSTFAVTSSKTMTAGTEVKHVAAPVVASAPIAAKPIVSNNVATPTVVAKAAPVAAPLPRTFVAPKTMGLTLATTQPVEIKGNFLGSAATSSMPVPRHNMTFVPPTAIHVALATTKPIEVGGGFAMAGSTTNVPTHTQAMTYVAPKVFVAPKATGLTLIATQPMEVGGGIGSASALATAPKHEQAVTFMPPKANLALLATPVREPALDSSASLVPAVYHPGRPVTRVAGLNLKLMTVSAKNQSGGWIAPLPLDSVSEHRQLMSHVVSVSGSFGAMGSGSRPVMATKVVTSEPAMMQAVPMAVATSMSHGSVSAASIPMTVSASAAPKAIGGKVISQPEMAEAVPSAKGAEMDRPAVTSTNIAVQMTADAAPKTANGKVVSQSWLADAVPAAKAPQATDRPAVTSTQMMSVPVAAEAGLKPAATGKVVSTSSFSEDVPVAKSTSNTVSRPAVTSTEISTPVSGPVAKVPSNGRVMSTPSLAEAVPAAKIQKTDSSRDVKTDVMGSPVTGITEHAQPKSNPSSTPVFNQQSGQAMNKAPRGQVENASMPAVIGESE